MVMQILGVIGLFGGALIGLAGWYFGRKKALAKRALDETHDHIWRKARSFSWYITIGAIYFIFTLYLIGITMAVPIILSMLILVQLASWAFSGLVLSGRMYNWLNIDRYFIIGTVIIIVSVLLFTFIVFLTENFYYLLWTIPIGIIGIYFINKSKHVDG